MLYLVILSFFLAYEIQKIIQFNFFFKLKRISLDYYLSLLSRSKSVAFKELVNISFIESIFIIVLFIGLFTYNKIFICAIIILFIFESYTFKYIKKNSIRKKLYFLNIILSILLLVLSIVNILFFNLDDIQLIIKLLNSF